MEILIILLGIVGLAYTIIFHEVAHGLMADRLGDPTARISKRLTLNPIPHIDPLGTIIVPLLMYFSPAHFVFGWAKPVPFDPYNLKNPKKDILLISLAGPLSNILLAIFFAAIFRFVPMPQIGADFLKTLTGLNVGLAIFNLIPISPLDGEKILAGLLPDRAARKLEYFMDKFGMILLASLIFPIFGGVSLISPVLYPIINFVLNLLIPGFPKY